jgi:hypothetical protein
VRDLGSNRMSTHLATVPEPVLAVVVGAGAEDVAGDVAEEVDEELGPVPGPVPEPVPSETATETCC